jgi:DNA-binding transcriptional MerR regulator
VIRDLLPIGTFARRCRLSVKALRHYGELGLLRPVHVDVATGYRYYHRRQAPAAIAIALLRSLGVPLPAIRDLLASEDPEAMTRILDRERERQAREVSRAATALRSIERLIGAGTVFPYDVTLRDEPEQTVLVVEGTTTADLHVAAGTALVHDLLERLGRLGRPQVGPIMCLVHATTDETLTLQMCSAIAEPLPGEHVLALPATSVAVTRHIGPYEELGLAEHALHAWAEERRLEPSGLLREVYHNDPAEVAPEALETEVLLPVSRPSARTPGTGAARP